jgi:hypothetical protein
MRIKISVNYINVISSLKGELPIELNESIKKSFRENKFDELEQLLKNLIEPFFDIPEILKENIFKQSIDYEIFISIKPLNIYEIPIMDIEIDCTFEINCKIEEFYDRINKYEQESNDVIQVSICFKWKNNIAEIESWDRDFFYDTYEYEREEYFIEKILTPEELVELHIAVVKDLSKYSDNSKHTPSYILSPEEKQRKQQEIEKDFKKASFEGKIENLILNIVAFILLYLIVTFFIWIFS